MRAHTFTRREWMVHAGAVASGMLLSRNAAAADAMPKLCVFSKYLQFLDYPALAATLKAAGADGVDLTVRDKGHVLPENVERDLPLAVEAMKAEGLSVEMIATNLKSGAEPYAENTLATMAAQGIKFLRVGYHKYDETGDPVQQIEAIEKDCRSLAGLCEKHGVYAGYHNHSGGLNFGAAMWDLLGVIQRIGSPHFGSNFDIGHCMVEGAYGDWDITTRAFAKHAKMCAVKDFKFQRAEPRWVPLGEGIVPVADFLQRLKVGGFTGPIGIHFEYPEHTKADEPTRIQHVGEAVAVLRAEMGKVWA